MNDAHGMPAVRRRRCERCQRPASHCLCAYVQQVSHRTGVLVLQHPDEQRHPLNTARLAVLGLSHAECWVGDVFDALPQRLAAARRPALLFPGPDARTPHDWLASAAQEGTPDLLIVPDGTWRQAGRLVRVNPVLQGLARLMLEDGEPSRYQVRKANRPGAVSTLEAIVRTLSVLEPQVSFLPVLRPFEALVAGQIRAMTEAGVPPAGISGLATDAQ